MKLSIDFAFEGFRIVRQNPMVILAWGIVSLIVNGIAFYTLIAMAGPALQELMKVQTNPAAAQDPQAVFALLGQLMPALCIAILIGVVVGAVIMCAVLRCVLEPGKGGFGYLALGGDEIRQIVLGIINVFLFFGLYIAALIAATLVGGIVAVVLSLLAKPLAVIGVIVGVVVFIWFFCWAMIRLSLNSAQSFVEKKLNVFGSFSLTKGYSFTLLGGYLVMAIMAMLVSGLCILIFTAIAAGFNHGDVASLPFFDQSKLMNLESLKNPLVIAYYAMRFLLVTPLVMALAYGAPAAACKSLMGFTPKTADAVF